MMPFYLLMLAGVAGGYYVGVGALKWFGGRDGSVVPILTALAGGGAAYLIALSIAPPLPEGDIVWAETVRQVFNQEELDTVLAEDPAKATLVDFYADWCPPCHAEAPGLNELAMAGERIVVVNVERSPTLADRYNVVSLPTALIFRNGREVHRASGFHSRRELQRLLSRHTGS